MVSINGPRTAGIPPVTYDPSGFWDKDYQEEVRPFNLKELVEKGKGKPTPTTQQGLCQSPQAVGMKYDGGKDMWYLLPLKVISGVVKVLTFGAIKYKPNSWQEVDGQRYYAAANRHLEYIVSGEEKDTESGLHHAYHYLCNCVFIAWKLANGDNKWLKDMYK